MITPLIILLLLTLPLCAALAMGKHKQDGFDKSKFGAFGLGLAFVFFFIGHFVKTQGMTEMLPPWVPLKLTLVYLTGILELCIAVALFTTKYRVAAAKLAIVVLIVFFPANIYSAINAVGLGGHQWGPIYLLIRAPLQLILISWAYFICVKGAEKSILKSV